VTLYPNKPKPSSAGYKRVVNISATDLVDPNPDLLTSLKRAVHEVDLLQVSDPVAWAALFDRLPALWQPLFKTSILDRDRFRYAVYGWNQDLKQDAYTAVSIALLGKVAAWLRNDATLVDPTSWSSILDGNNPTQSVAARRPTADVNGHLSFATNDCYPWLLNGQNNFTTKWGLCGWMRQPVSALETLFCIYDGVGGATARKLYLQTNTARRLVFGAFISGNDGRQMMTPSNSLPVAGTPTFVYFAYDSSLGGDANIKIFIDFVEIGGLVGANLGVGGVLTTLPAPTGFALFGNLANSAGGSTPYNGTLSKNWYLTSDTLTVAEQQNLAALEPLV
jgi:hypothetical protein